ncbi:C-type mannose receptor 2-like [Glandiceps talaboti]
MKGVYVCTAFLVILLQIFQAEGSCNEGWRLNERKNTCYKLWDRTKNFDAAQRTCKAAQEGADLVRVYGTAEANFLNGLIEEFSTKMCTTKMECSFWIGLSSRGDDKTSFDFVWVDGNRPEDHKFKKWTGGSPWLPGAPSATVKNSCVFIRGGNYEEAYKWADSKCDVERCPSGWHFYDRQNSCYKLSKNQLTYDRARKACKNYGVKDAGTESADLVRVHGSAENKFLRGLLTETLKEEYYNSACESKMQCSFWIGLSSKGEENTCFQHRWLDAGKPANIDFSQWVHGSPWLQEPNKAPSGNPKDSCVFIRPVTYEWADSTCETNRNFFCAYKLD